MLAAIQAARTSLTAAGVKGRFRGESVASAPGLVPDTAPILPLGKSAAIVPINAVAATEPEEVA
jgi:hypothetical protein